MTLYLDGPFGAPFAGEMAAEKLGYLSESGIKIILQPEPHQPDFIGHVARSHAVGVTSGQRFLLARWRGEPIVAFAASLLDTTTAIFTLQRSGLRTPQDLVGKRLSFQPGSEDAVVFEALMVRLGLPRSQVNNIAVPDRFAALRRGEVDAVIAPLDEQPVPSNEDATGFNVIRPQNYGIHIPGLVYFAGADLVRDHPSIIQQVLRGIIAGWQEVYADLDKVVPLLVAHDPTRLTPEAVRFGLLQQRDLVRPTGMRIADFDESRWTTLRDILVFARVGEQTESLSAGVSYQFLREAYRKPLKPEGASSGAFGN